MSETVALTYLKIRKQIYVDVLEDEFKGEDVHGNVLSVKFNTRYCCVQQGWGIILLSIFITPVPRRTQIILAVKSVLTTVIEPDAVRLDCY